MMITANHRSYIRQEDIKLLAHLTADTVDRVFAYLLEPLPEINKMYDFNSYKKWHNERDKEDALAELCSYLTKWEPERLLTEFNSHRFNFWLANYFRSHLMTKGVFWRKYTDKGRVENALELDDPLTHYDPIDKEYDLSIHSLSIFQFQKLITHLLNTERAKREFEQEHVDFFLEYFIDPIAQGKKVTITEVAKQQGINYKLLHNRVRSIKKFLKGCIENQYDVSFIYTNK